MEIEEDRSFAMVERAALVGEVLPVEDGLTGDALTHAGIRQTEQVHRCLEQHVARTVLAEVTATKKRNALTKKVETIGKRQTTVAKKVDLIAGQVRALTLALEVEKPAAGEERPAAKVKAHVSRGQWGGLVMALFGAAGFWKAVELLLTKFLT